MAINKNPLPGTGQQSIQVFTPTRIETVAPAGSLDTSAVTAIRVDIDTDYQINGAGTTGTMPPGSTGIHTSVSTLTFPNGATVEVMD